MDNQTTAPQSPADRAQTVGQDTKQAAQSVASTAGQEAQRTTREATDQARQLLSEARTGMVDQASAQQSRAAEGLRELSEQLQSMAGSADSGMAQGLVQDVARRTESAATWLDQRDPGSLVEEARGFARRRPMAFLAAAAGLGLVAGRLSRGLMDDAKDSGSSPSASTSGTGAPVTGGQPMFTEGVGTTSTTGMASTGMGSTGELPEVHRSTQPIAPDGTPSPIDTEGRLTVGDDLGGGPR